METGDIIKLVGSGGLALVVLGAFLWLIRTVGVALVAEIKRLGEKVDKHTDVDLEHHGAVKEDVRDLRQDIAVLSESVAIALDWERTPRGTIIPPEHRAPSRRVRTRPEGVPVGEYAQHRRASSRSEDDK